MILENNGDLVTCSDHANIMPVNAWMDARSYVRARWSTGYFKTDVKEKPREEIQPMGIDWVAKTYTEYHYILIR